MALKYGLVPMRSLLASFGLLLLMPSCFGGPSSWDDESGNEGDDSSSPFEGSSDPDASNSPGGNSPPPAAPAREGGEVPEIKYGTGTNVAEIEDRGAACPLPALHAFQDLEEQALLPDPFLSLGGDRIDTKAAWTCRRAEILAQVQAYEFGPKPPKPERVTGSLQGDTLRVTVEHGEKKIEFEATLRHPDTGDAPHPAMIVLGGTTALDAEGTISGQGVAMIEFPHEAIAAQQSHSSYGDGLFYELYGADYQTGALSAWAWGVSRLIDALEETPDANIDTSRLGVTGCSRNGKGALAVGAMDERIALTLPQESGAGGSALWRLAQAHHEEWVADGMMPDYAAVQTLSHAATENAWFRKSFSQFGNAVDRLPFDHHMVMGLVAPRALLVVNNTEQYWLDRKGSHFGAVFAHSIWQAMGVADNMGGSQVGSSRHCFDVPALQLEHVAAYVAKFLVGDDDADTAIMYTDGRFADVSNDWVDWDVPSLQ